MILIIIFGLLFLIGTSFLVAVVGMSFLKKRVVRVSEPAELEVTEGEYGERFRGEYRERLAGVREAVEAETRPLAPAGPGIPLRQLPYPVSGARGSGKLAIIVIAILIVFGASLYFGLHGFNLGVKPKLYLAEDVDFTRLKPINKSRTFTRGNVAVLVRSRKPLGLEGARIEVYRMALQGFELYATSRLPLKPEWTSFTVKVLFDSVGSYLVSVTEKDGTLIAQKNISIVPDSFAYRPVLPKS